MKKCFVIWTSLSLSLSLSLFSSLPLSSSFLLGGGWPEFCCLPRKQSAAQHFLRFFLLSVCFIKKKGWNQIFVAQTN